MDADEPRKGRSNAILTYERIEELNNKLTYVAVTLEAMREDQKRSLTITDDHELRLRTLAADVAGMRQTLDRCRDDARSHAERLRDLELSTTADTKSREGSRLRLTAIVAAAAACGSLITALFNAGKIFHLFQ